jgi:hypothetical protein
MDLDISAEALASMMLKAYDARPTYEVAGDVRLVIVDNYVLIPGTRPTVLQDWHRDLEISSHKMSDHGDLGYCHDGCLTGAEAAYGVLPRKTWTIVGHSLGGGIGQLLAALLVAGGNEVKALVTFGSMRAFAGEEVIKILAPVSGANIVHDGDQVPELPPALLADDDMLKVTQPWRKPTVIGHKHFWLLDNHYMASYELATRERKIGC